MPKLKHNRLLKQLKYDPLTGVFTWLVTRNRITQGDVAGSVSKKGYRVIRIDGEHHKAHRLAWFYVHGSWPSGVIDHKDGNKDNNKIKNLRDTSQAVNCENIRKPRNNLMGASYVKKLDKWKAQITVKGTHLYLGVFDTEQLAHEAYMIAKRQHHKGFV